MYMLWFNIKYPWFKFYFPLFLGMVMYDNEFKTKESKIQTKDRIEPQHICHLSCVNVMKDEKTYPCHVTKSFLTCQREKKIVILILTQQQGSIMFAFLVMGSLIFLIHYPKPGSNYSWPH